MRGRILKQRGDFTMREYGRELVVLGRDGRQVGSYSYDETPHALSLACELFDRVAGPRKLERWEELRDV